MRASRALWWAEAMVMHMRDIQNAEIRATARDLVHYAPRLRATVPAWLREETGEHA